MWMWNESEWNHMENVGTCFVATITPLDSRISNKFDESVHVISGI